MALPQKWESILELLSCLLLAVWLQVVGVVTDSVLHHLLHALPFLFLWLIPDASWRSFTGALLGFAWIFMLGVVTENLSRAFQLFPDGLRTIAVLAPVTAALSSLFMSVCLSRLQNFHYAFLAFLPICFGLVPLFVVLRPVVSSGYAIALINVLNGSVFWGGILFLEMTLTLLIPGTIIYGIINNDALFLSRSAILYQVFFWTAFLGCMIGGLSLDRLF